mmetsp:Transcript_8591/g.12665  ORF Transcript_8591/g.12665 Transcript_8591/m.12665 type:complete len:105 (+) Transcript_8591:2-316(+)
MDKNVAIEAQELKYSSKIAHYREYTRWIAGYSTGLIIGTLIWSIKTKRFPYPMVLPISAGMTCGYYCYDKGYGYQSHRVNREAHKILKNERKKYFKRIDESEGF